MVKVFLDTSVIFAAVYSETGGSRMILKMAEAKIISIWIGPWVLKEAEAVIERKAPASKSLFALLLDRSHVSICQAADRQDELLAESIVGYKPDAQVLAEALTINADYFVSLDRKHLIGNPSLTKLPFPVGTPGEFLEWYKGHMTS